VADAAFRDHAVEQALHGKVLSPDVVSAAVQLAAKDAMILGDHYATEAYRGHLARVFLKRALQQVIA
jgi:carbon-monoxide dehydrogenase medium subunit